MLRIDHLSIGGLPDMTFGVASGECLAVEGPSGSGKTRLLRAICDLDPASGYVYLDGAERGEMTGPEWRRKVRYVSAEPAWWAETPRAHSPPVLQPRLERLLPTLGLDVQLLDQPVAELSTGERQRIALARALADEPRVVMLDEPTSALDPVAAALVEELIRFLTLSGRILLLISHDAAQIERLAHARLILPSPKAAGAVGAASTNGNGPHDQPEAR